jgi:hypothetical protein
MDNEEEEIRRRGEQGKPVSIDSSAVSFQRAVKCLNQSSFVAVDGNISIDRWGLLERWELEWNRLRP